MKSTVSQKEINDIVWKACDSFRGAIDPSEYKNYILTMLFIKYLTDLWKDKKEAHAKKYSNDKERVERALSRERFIVPPESDFDFLYGQRDASNIGELINQALHNIEEANKQKLENVFRNIDFNSEAALGQTKDRNKRLQNLLKDFSNEKLDMRPSRIGNRDVIGDVYEYLIGKFASDAGKKAGEFYSPPEVSTLLAKLVQPKPGDKICDPACGSGSLLIKVAHEVGSEDYALFGQESNGSTWSLGRMNMFLHGMDGARIEWGDTIDNPRLIEKDNLMHFNIVVANPPFSLEKWGHENAEKDKHRRFWRGIPPKSRGDYAFISHMVETALVGEGKVGVIVPHGVLFRGGSEGTIRTKFIEENILEAVIGLPSQLFFGTGIPAAILIFNKARKHWREARTTRDKHILFIDASREFEDGKKQNRLRDQDIQKIVKTFKSFDEIEKYSHRATLSEIQEAEFNLNIPRYVDTFEEEEEINIPAVQKEIKSLEAELAKTQKELDGYLKELRLG
ncbi:type I restriction-modification system subunit M [Leptospira neocaledonica]|uniref:site-specific DNA-methyltransferase (adenine-specific) n=1 Tax=Leptospira neocaledonica TaxID=2023192 RepID=A0A2M9ZXZ0_9LEPT|nr:type I restriction-modification system subunit M [Leptospira neocaledonica]PJZ76942.1 type I restriction-modification system subunit M [Leptospira neocaledonica]